MKTKIHFNIINGNLIFVKSSHIYSVQYIDDSYLIKKDISCLDRPLKMETECNELKVLSDIRERYCHAQ